MSLACWDEFRLDSDMDLSGHVSTLIESAEPRATSTGQRSWLVDLEQPEPFGVEPSRQRFCARRARDLYVVQLHDATSAVLRSQASTAAYAALRGSSFEMKTSCMAPGDWQ